MSRWNLAWLLGISAITMVGLSLSYSAPRNVGNLQKRYENLDLIVDVIEEVRTHYAKKLDEEKMRDFVEDMINGGLQRLDPHSGFFSEDDFKQFEKHSKGKFGGVGIRIVQDPPLTGRIYVESPMVGAPAYKAGVLAGDVIVKVDGKSIEGMTIKEVADLIQGKPGDKVTLSVVHEGAAKPEDIDVTRAIIRIDSVLGDRPQPKAEEKWDFIVDEKNKVAYIRIVAFTETTVAELSEVVRKLQLQGMKGLVLDLRDNPGGLLRTAVEVSGMFLPGGKKVVSTKGRSRSEEVYRARTPAGFAQPVLNVPIAILLNRYSASASEIVAAALKDHLRAVIVGERSYGKGSVQNVIRLEGGKTALKLTTASYWRPSGKNIHRFPRSKKEDEWGVKPNKGYEVKLTLEERKNYYKYRRERDVVRDHNGDQPKKNDKTDKNDEEFKDRVLEKALEYLRKEIAANGKAKIQNGGRRIGDGRPRVQNRRPPASLYGRFPLIPNVKREKALRPAA